MALKISYEKSSVKLSAKEVKQIVAYFKRQKGTPLSRASKVKKYVDAMFEKPLTSKQKKDVYATY